MDAPRGDEGHDTAPDVFNRAIGCWKSGDRLTALALLEQVAEGLHGEVDEAYAERVLRKLLSYVSRRDWPETERIAQRTVERLPLAAFGYRHLGEALYRQGHVDAAKAPLEHAVRLDPGDADARILLSIVRRGEGAKEHRTRRAAPWPLRQYLFDDARSVIERSVLRGYPNPSFVRGDTVFMALGSCFAVNLAQRLQVAGHTAHWEMIGEEINSTYANRFLLDWIEHGPSDAPTRAIDSAYGDERRERLRAALKAAHVLVLTLGVAPCFFNQETGEFVFTSLGSKTARDFLHHGCVMRTTTVAENVANLETILDSARRVAGHDLQVVLTVSPVPLAGTTEHYSAVLADCLSKSTLRLACEEVLTKRPDAIYWPSFEIVRWLGAHYSAGLPPVFGGDDNNTRHVSAWLVELIVDLFISHNTGDPVDTAARWGPDPASQTFQQDGVGS